MAELLVDEVHERIGTVLLTLALDVADPVRLVRHRFTLHRRRRRAAWTSRALGAPHVVPSHDSLIPTPWFVALPLLNKGVGLKVVPLFKN